jgi:hypothetical protein
MLLLKITIGLVTLSTVVIGIIGNTWDKRRQRPTRVGGVAITLGGVLFILGATEILLTDHQNRRERSRYEQEKSAAIVEAERRKDVVITALRHYNQSLSESLIRSRLYESGISVIEIDITHRTSSEYLRNLTFTLVFSGKGAPWGFIMHGASMHLHAGTKNLDNMGAGVPFRLQDSGNASVDPDEYLSPPSYFYHDSFSFHYRAEADALALDQGMVPIYFGRDDVVSSDRITLKISGEDCRIGDKIELASFTVRIGHRDPIELLDKETTLLVGEPDTRLGEPFARAIVLIPRGWW